MTSRLFVYERTPLNAPSLARLSALDLNEVRSLPQARAAIQRAPTGIVALDLRFDNVVPALDLARWAKSRFPVALIAMPRRSIDQRWNPFLYEAGVDLIFRSNLDLNLVRRLIRRQAARQADLATRHAELAANRAPIPFRKQVWQRLPWKRQAMGGGS